MAGAGGVEDAIGEGEADEKPDAATAVALSGLDSEASWNTVSASTSL